MSANRHQPASKQPKAASYAPHSPSKHPTSYRHLGMFDSDKNFKQHTSDTPDTRIDKFTFFGTLFILIAVTLPLVVFPEQGADWVAATKTFVTNKFGGAYLAFGVLSLVFVTYICCSDIGNIKLGKAEDDIEFKTGSWAAMMFCGGIGASILYWGILEWMYYTGGRWRGRFIWCPPFRLPISPMCATHRF